MGGIACQIHPHLTCNTSHSSPTLVPTISLILCTVRPQRLSNQYHHPLLLWHTTLDKPDTIIVCSCPQLDLGMLGHAYINSGSSVALCCIHLPIVPMCPSGVVVANLIEGLRSHDQ